jgi:hypothetical protein
MILLYSSFILREDFWARSSAVEQWTHNPLVVGSNPTGPICLYDKIILCFHVPLSRSFHRVYFYSVICSLFLSFIITKYTTVKTITSNVVTMLSDTHGIFTSDRPLVTASAANT